jgi:hypothetical protein
MRHPTRLLLLLACCAAMTAGAYQAAARLLDAACVAALADATATAERLRRALACSEARFHFKEGLAGGLASGRLSLAAAIGRVRAYLDEEALAEGPEAQFYGRGVLDTVPGRSEDERCGRNLIRLVQLDLRGSPGLAARVVVRLEHELAEHLARPGKGQLPAPAGPPRWPG